MLAGGFQISVLPAAQVGRAAEVGYVLVHDTRGARCFGYKAAAAGAKEQEAKNALEKIIKKKQALSEVDTIQEAIKCLQAVMGMDFKSTDIEVGVVSKARPRFTRLSEEQIDSHLTAIAEKD